MSVIPSSNVSALLLVLCESCIDLTYSPVDIISDSVYQNRSYYWWNSYSTVDAAVRLFCFLLCDLFGNHADIWNLDLRVLG